MKRKFLLTLPLACFALIGMTACGSDDIEENVIYAAPTGKETAKGSKKSPLDVRTAFKKLTAGDTLILLDGNYKLNDRILVSAGQDGKEGNPITVKADDGASVTFDFTEQTIASVSRGIQINANYWYLYGFDVMGAGDNGVYIAGSYNIVENCSFHENQDTGLQIGRADSSQTNIKDWPHNNLIKNCTSYNNYDYQSYGENADGFAAKLTTGEGNVFDGCIAYRNSDDGWDLYAKSDSGKVGTTIIKNCLSFQNGWLMNKTASPSEDDLDKYGVTTITTTAQVLAKKTNTSFATRDGDGIGFKLGGSVMEGNVIVENCMAFENRLHGLSDNSNPGVLSLKNCTAYNNSATCDSETGAVLPNGNTSNNFDLARDEKSYNNYYGLLSYMTNQTTAGITYSNKDAYRGSTAYSIFNSGKNKYTCFTDFKDASNYDSTASGKAYNSMSDSIFESVNFEYDATGNTDIHKLLRNADGSINTGKMLNVVSPDLLSYCDGKQIGAKLNESSWNAYDHYNILNNASTGDDTMDTLLGARDVLEIMCNKNAVYQNVNLITKVNNCDVTWSSSDELLVQCGKPKADNPNEFETNTSSSGVTYIEGIIHRNRETDKKVILTATISLNGQSLEKKFELNIKRNIPTIGSVVGFEDRYILTQFGEYELPTITVLNASMYSEEALIEGEDYKVETKILFANSSKDFIDGNYYEISKVYTSLPGVYKVIYNVESLISDEHFETSFNAYVVSEEAEIDISTDTEGNPNLDVNVSRDGVQVSASFTNILGNMYVYTSKNETEDAQTVVTNGKAFDITDETLSSIYEMPNNDGYFVHVCVNNKKNTIESPTVYSKEITIQNINTKDEFFDLVNSKTSSTIIYLLTTDLDFTGYNWTATNTEPFGGLFNGNGHTIKNIKIVSAEAKGTAVFYKLKNGTIENVTFENVSLKATSANASLAGIVGQMCGGFIHNIALKNISCSAASAASALVGKVTGGINYITQVSLVNDESMIINVEKKYCGGIVGSLHSDTSEKTDELYISDCYVKATIGDGKDNGGFIGGIIGRNKNEFAFYKLSVTKCIFEGQVKTGKDYSGGIIGGCDNGAGTVTVQHCAANCTILLKGNLLDGIQASAAKNDSPIFGRVTKGVGAYYVTMNYARFADSQFTSDTENFEENFKTAIFFKNNLSLDIESIWIFDSETLTISLRGPASILAK